MDLRTFFDKEKPQTWLAGQLGLTQGAVSQWLKKGVPPCRVLAVERATGGKVSRHEMRPDLYPVESRRNKSNRK